MLHRWWEYMAFFGKKWDKKESGNDYICRQKLREKYLHPAAAAYYFVFRASAELAAHCYRDQN